MWNCLYYKVETKVAVVEDAILCPRCQKQMHVKGFLVDGKWCHVSECRCNQTRWHIGKKRGGFFDVWAAVYV